MTTITHSIRVVNELGFPGNGQGVRLEVRDGESLELSVFCRTRPEAERVLARWLRDHNAGR